MPEIHKPVDTSRFSGRRPGQSRLVPAADKKTMKKTTEVLSKMPGRLRDYAKRNACTIAEVDPDAVGYYYE